MSTPPPPRGGLGGPTDEPDPTGIRALLSSLPDPGPMPPDLVDRITASIAAEQAGRGHLDRERGATVVPLRTRRWRWPQVAAVAAAAAVIAVGVPTLLNGGGSDVMAAFTSRGSSGQSGADAGSAQSGADSGSDAERNGNMSQGATGIGPLVSPSPGTRVGSPQAQTVMHASATAYAAATLTSQVRTVLAGPASTVTAPAADAEGLRRCLAALGVAAWMPVSADRARYEGRPAVVVLVTSDTGQLVWVVDPSCTAQHPLALAGPVPLT